MPVVGVLTGGIDFSDFSWTLKKAVGDVPAVSLNYGLFINAVISFVIVAFAIFTVVKLMNKLQKQKDVEPIKEEKPSKEEVLLTEIRDLLKSK
jgi:large conductance mechanosensitive channel